MTRTIEVSFEGVEGDTVVLNDEDSRAVMAGEAMVVCTDPDTTAGLAKLDPDDPLGLIQLVPEATPAPSPTGGCNGACCKRFNLELSPDDLAAFAAAHGDGTDYPDTWTSVAGIDHPFRPRRDIHQIAEMVIYLEWSDVQSDGKAAAPHRHWYTCRHHDGSLCTIYDDRPSMCSAYPYGDECLYPGCKHEEPSAAFAKDLTDKLYDDTKPVDSPPVDTAQEGMWLQVDEYVNPKKP